MPEDRGVVASIERLRLRRYNDKGPGAKAARVAPRPSIAKLRGDMAKVAKKKPKPRRRR